ncbi:hypothetical protein FOWG_11687 [Fusarium oxysporum f. sp. lycopersici MN25]|nr:hypothetical protein FOWG_11687 [Fusarium oxysporum f. sp. lycopersici MN25]
MSASLMQTCPCHAPGDDPAEITTLHQAAFHQNNQRLEELLQDNADVSATQTPRDFTPLHYAVQFGDEKSVQLLIDAGSNVSARSYDGVTPLHNTSAGGNVRITEMLLKAGANVESRNIDEETPLHVVRWGGCLGEGGDTLLHRAAQSSSELVRDLVKGGIDLEATNDEGATALHCAAAWGETASMQIIIESGANFNAANNDGETVLHIVAGNPSLRSGRDSGTKAKLLIDAGADIHAKAKSSETPLAYAVDCEGKAVEKVLREMGAA